MNHLIRMKILNLFVKFSHIKATHLRLKGTLRSISSLILWKTVCDYLVILIGLDNRADWLTLQSLNQTSSAF